MTHEIFRHLMKPKPEAVELAADRGCFAVNSPHAPRRSMVGKDATPGRAISVPRVDFTYAVKCTPECASSLFLL